MESLLPCFLACFAGEGPASFFETFSYFEGEYPC